MKENLNGIKYLLKKTRLVLLDLDGTTYIENELIPGVKEFIDKLRSLNMQYVFLTNNSSKSSEDYIKKINTMGIRATSENVFTSGQATSLYLQEESPGAKIYLVGNKFLKSEMSRYGLNIINGTSEKPDYVVVGFDTELEYQKLVDACKMIDDGIPFLATHPDMVCPVRGRRYIPDCGSICQMIKNATGREPKYFGKPDKKMVYILSDKIGVGLENIVMIGDRLYTDIALGKNAGISTICVLTGESTLNDIKKSAFSPDFVVESISRLIDYL